MATGGHIAVVAQEFSLEGDLARARKSLEEGTGWFKVKSACDPDKDCKDMWNELGSPQEESADSSLGPDSAIRGIFLSTILSPLTRRIFDRDVVLAPQPSMVHFPTKAPRGSTARIDGAPLYKTNGQPRIIMKMQFGGEMTKFLVLILNNSHKMGHIGEAVWVEFMGALCGPHLERDRQAREQQGLRSTSTAEIRNKVLAAEMETARGELNKQLQEPKRLQETKGLESKGVIPSRNDRLSTAEARTFHYIPSRWSSWTLRLYNPRYDLVSESI
ncbi:hypothetical protein GP486_003222 [Trichoglossum hirsutum]|uniref:Uncharacterized protein n=1 Tax=Trichoglossum hirsutum TaxID=265104 RepID=A0A9P8LDH0_9PEZI|nr:hypothetical protein GP486_003222 [Trichoglossum hirsutum]